MVNNARFYESDADCPQHAPAEDFELKTPQTVYYYEADGLRRLVATHSVRAALTLLEVTRYFFLQNGGTSNLTEDLEVALSDPGAVFERKGDQGQWKKVKSAAIAAKLPKRGGARAGSGQKPISEDGMSRHSFFCTTEQWDALSRKGGEGGAAAAIRKFADEAIAKEKKQAREPGKQPT